MWRDRIDGNIAFTHADIRNARPGWSAPHILTPPMIDFIGFDPVVPVVPDYDPATQQAVQVSPMLVNGKWTQQWNIIPLE